MRSRPASIHSPTEIEVDELPLILRTSSEQQVNRNISNSSEDSLHRTHTIDEDDRETAPLLDEYKVEPSASGYFLCADVPTRYTMAIWVFFGIVCLYAMRVNLSVAIVAMVASQSSLNQSVKACPVLITNSTTPPSKYEFTWKPSEQGTILGAFFYGYLVMQVIGGNIAEKFGGKWIFAAGILISGILTLLIPIAARFDSKLLIAVRVLTGVASGLVFPAAAALWGKWIPPLERSTVPAAAQTGTSMGIILTTPLVSIMVDDGFLGGWPSAFYVFGIMSCVWFIGWCFFGFNSPQEHPRISKKERVFLSKHIVSKRVKHTSTPWKKIVTCPPVYGIAIMQICTSYVYYTLLTSLPTYFSTILNFNLHQNGFIFAIPYFAQFLVTIIAGQLVDRLRKRNVLSITALRKTQTIIGTVGGSVSLVAIGFMGCNHVSAVICCILAVSFLGIHSCGASISHLDVASNYAGTLVGITNSLGSIPGFVAPAVVGVITNNNQTIEAWRLIFIISAGIGVVGCLAYCILFNGEEQPWNRIGYENDSEETINNT